MPIIPALQIPPGYQAQSVDTSCEIDWLFFQRLREMPLSERIDRYCSFTTSMRTGFKLRSLTCAESVTQRLGDDWLSFLKYPNAMAMVIDPISFSRKVAAILNSLGINYYIGGSFASSIYGESRNTRDIDLIIEIDRPQVREIIDAFLSADFYISETAVIEAIEDPDPRKSFNVLDNRSVEKADLFVLKPDAFNQSKMQRRRTIEIPGDPLYVCSPEDIVLQKLVWRTGTDSDQQWQDVLGVLKVQGDTLDFRYLKDWGNTLGISNELNRAIKAAGLELTQ